MVDILIDLVTAAMNIGSITAAHMYSPDLITIDGATSAGKNFTISFRYVDGSEKDASTNP